MSGFYGPIGKAKRKVEREDLEKLGYSSDDTVEGQMSYGYMRKGRILSWLPESDDRIKECISTVGHDKVMIKFIDHFVASLTYVNKALEDEVRLVRTLKPHPNLAVLYDVARSSDEYRTYMIQEDPAGQGVIKYMAERNFSEKKARHIVAQVASAMHHCHKNGFVHRNLHSNDIRVDKNGHVKVLDFGLSPKLSVRDVDYLHSYNKYSFRAPESLHTIKNSTPAADMFSLGVIMYEMLHGTLPYTGTQQQLEYKMRLQELTFGPNISAAAVKLMKKLLSPDPWKRPLSEAVLNDPWIMRGQPANPGRPIIQPKEKQPCSLPKLVYKFKDSAIKTHARVTLGKDTIILKSRQPVERRAYAMDRNYTELKIMNSIAALKKSKLTRDVTNNVMSDVIPSVDPTRAVPTKAPQTPTPQPPPPVEDPPQTRLAVVGQQVAVKVTSPSALSPVKVIEEVSEPFGAEPAASESTVSLVGFGGSESVTPVASPCGSVSATAATASSSSLDTYLDGGDEIDLSHFPLIEYQEVQRPTCVRSAPLPSTSDPPTTDPIGGIDIPWDDRPTTSPDSDVCDISYIPERASPVPSDLGSDEVDLDYTARSPSPPGTVRVSPSELTQLKYRLDQQGSGNQDILGFLSDVWRGMKYRQPANNAGPPQSATQPGVSATQPKVSATKPGVSATQPGIPVNQPRVSATKPGVPVSQPGVSATRPGVPVSQPGISDTKPGVPVSQPGISDTKPGVPVSQPLYIPRPPATKAPTRPSRTTAARRARTLTVAASKETTPPISGLTGSAFPLVTQPKVTRPSGSSVRTTKFPAVSGTLTARPPSGVHGETAKEAVSPGLSVPTNSPQGKNRGQSPAKPGRHCYKPGQSPVKPDRPCYKPGQSPVKPDRPCYKPGQSPVKPDRPCYKPGQSPVKPDRHCYKPGQSPVKPDRHCYKPGQSPVKPDRHCYKPGQFPTERVVTKTCAGPPKSLTNQTQKAASYRVFVANEIPLRKGKHIKALTRLA